jgi:CheY-like chemotaxis protein
MPEGGKIAITTANRVVGPELIAKHSNVAPGDYVLLEVADTGSGIAPGDLEHVFEPFFTTKGVGEGTGLGLSMVHGFVEQSGGFVDIESRLGKGTNIRIYLPRAAEPAAGSKADQQSGARIPLVGATVLVVEDDPDVRQIVVGLLSGLGCAIIEAEDGKSAMSRLDEHRDIDVLFTDIVLPGGMGGHDIAAEARRRIPGLKIIFTSGYPDKEFNDLTGDEQTSFIRKPYRIIELAELLDKVLQS